MSVAPSQSPAVVIKKEGGKEADASSTRVETMQSTVFVDDDVISDVMV